jgi:hypothetical protein
LFSGVDYYYDMLVPSICIFYAHDTSPTLL